MRERREKTPFGKELLKILIDKDWTRKNFAEKYGCSVTFLNHVVLEPERATQKLLNKILLILQCNPTEAHALQQALWITRGKIAIPLTDCTDKHVQVALEFARRIHQLSEDKCDELLNTMFKETYNERVTHFGWPRLSFHRTGGN